MKACSREMQNREGMPTSFLKENKSPGNKKMAINFNSSESEQIGIELEETLIWRYGDVLQSRIMIVKKVIRKYVHV